MLCACQSHCLDTLLLTTFQFQVNSTEVHAPQLPLQNALPPPALPPIAQDNTPLSNEQSQLHPISMFNHQFSDFDLLRNHVDEYAKKENFIVSLNSREMIDLPIRGQTVRIHKRGTFCCSQRTAGAIKGSKCPYKINFSYNKKEAAYRLMSQSSMLEPIIHWKGG